MARRKDRDRINPNGQKLVQTAHGTGKAIFHDQGLCPRGNQIGDIDRARAGMCRKHGDKMRQEFSRADESKT
jgi:hypothetical protein